MKDMKNEHVLLIHGFGDYNTLCSIIGAVIAMHSDGMASSSAHTHFSTLMMTIWQDNHLAIQSSVIKYMLL